MSDAFSFYERLWREAEALGATVLYDGISEGGGSFHPNPHDREDDQPTILIYYRMYYQDISNPTRDRNPGGAELDPLISCSRPSRWRMSWALPVMENPNTSPGMGGLRRGRSPSR